MSIYSELSVCCCSLRVTASECNLTPAVGLPFFLPCFNNSSLLYLGRRRSRMSLCGTRQQSAVVDATERKKTPDDESFSCFCLSFADFICIFPPPHFQTLRYRICSVQAPSQIEWKKQTTFTSTEGKGRNSRPFKSQVLVFPGCSHLDRNNCLQPIQSHNQPTIHRWCTWVKKT